MPSTFAYSLYGVIITHLSCPMSHARPTFTYTGSLTVHLTRTKQEDSCHLEDTSLGVMALCGPLCKRRSTFFLPHLLAPLSLAPSLSPFGPGSSSANEIGARLRLGMSN
jgi:hypothetical protein